MTKTELESKPLSDLHQLAAAAGVERFRMLSRAELVERLSDGEDGGSASGAGSGDGEERSERPRRSRSRSRRSGSGSSSSSSGREREERTDVEEEEEEPAPSRRSRSRKAAPAKDAEPAAKDSDDGDSGDDEDDAKPRRRTRRRRRFGRRRDGLALQDLLLPAESGRQAVLLAETREGATELLRGVAAELAGADEGPDPVALLIDPSPEELADWKREAPQAELVSAGQARHANDALAAAQRRAADGEDVILLVDSLTRLAEGFGDTDTAKELFDAGRSDAAKGKGSLTVVVALERS
jgi:transcription termination factor Rho